MICPRLRESDLFLDLITAPLDVADVWLELLFERLPE